MIFIQPFLPASVHFFCERKKSVLTDLRETTNRWAYEPNFAPLFLTRLAREFGLDKQHSYVEQLQRVQCILQDVGSNIATPLSSAREAHLRLTEFDSMHVIELEEWIDDYTSRLSPLENFILPGGGKASCSLHVARTVARRCERATVPLVRQSQVSPEVLKYLNR